MGGVPHLDSEEQAECIHARPGQQNRSSARVRHTWLFPSKCCRHERRGCPCVRCASPSPKSTLSSDWSCVAKEGFHASWSAIEPKPGPLGELDDARSSPAAAFG